MLLRATAIERGDLVRVHLVLTIALLAFDFCATTIFVVCPPVLFFSFFSGPGSQSSRVHCCFVFFVISIMMLALIFPLPPTNNRTQIRGDIHSRLSFPRDGVHVTYLAFFFRVKTSAFCSLVASRRNCTTTWYYYIAQVSPGEASPTCKPGTLLIVLYPYM